MNEPTISVKLRPVAIAGAAVVVVVGVLMLTRQGLYIDTGRGFAGVERSFNWWGPGIGGGLVLSSLLGLGALAVDARRLLTGAALLGMVSGWWHPLLWPAVVAAIPMLVLGLSHHRTGDLPAAPPA